MYDELERVYLLVMVGSSAHTIAAEDRQELSTPCSKGCRDPEFGD